jgi:tetratricopeptide (TPR) repeat protein
VTVRPTGNAATQPTVATRAPFVGRQRELAELRAALDEAEHGRGSLFLVSGEPGIGKSRLADEAAAQAGGREFRVLWGRCWEAGGAPAYWPWVQALRGSLSDLDVGAVTKRLGPGAAEMARLLPDLEEVSHGVPAPVPTADPEAARFRLFEATAAFLHEASADRPVLLILDDLHAADTPSLLLLRFMASQLPTTRVVVLAAYRDVALEPGHQLSETLVELARERATRRIPLGGLSPEEVTLLIERSTGLTPPSSVAAAIHRETEGNPLFVGELVRLLAAEGGLADARTSVRVVIPDTVREVIGRRLDALTLPCRRLLPLASVFGREFSLEALKRLSGQATREILGFLGEAADARILTDAPGSVGRLRFSHALIRDTLYDELALARRFDLHKRAGDVLAELYGGDVDQHLAELAHHFVEASPAGDAERAADYARRAADRAASLLAYEEAIRLYDMALQALDVADGDDPAARCDVLLAMGETQTKAGDAAGAKGTFLQAAELARKQGMPERLGLAALGYGGRFVWLRPGSDRRMVPLLEEALAALGEEDSHLRVSLLARLAGALRDQPAREPRAALSAEAVERARRLGDPATLAYALVARFAANWGPENDEERLAIATELVGLAERIGDPDREIEGRLLRTKVLMTLGDLAGVHRELAVCKRLADERRQPSQQWYVEVDRASLNLFEGRFTEAEQSIHAVLRLGERAQRMDAQVAYRLQLFQLRKEQGRLDEIEDLIRQSVAEYPWYPMFRCVLANLAATLGRREEARRLLGELAEDRFAPVPLDNEWLFAMCFLPEVTDGLADAERAATLYDLLLPYEDRNAYSPPELCIGPVGRYLGIAAAAAGKPERAVEHLDRTLRRAEAMGARPWEAHARHDLARVLQAREGPSDRERAEILGMSALRDRATAGLAPFAPTGAAPVPEEGSFRLDGDIWMIRYGERSVRLRDSKGLRYLHRLLRAPGGEIHVADLVGSGPPNHRVAADPGEFSPDAGHAGEMLDPQARRAYARRVDELREETEEAERWGDQERAARARAELEFIERELAAAYGLAGRSRRAADTSERMRKAVTNRIRDAIARINAEHADLGLHLRNAVSTGTFCSYRPDRPVKWDLKP